MLPAAPFGVGVWAVMEQKPPVHVISITYSLFFSGLYDAIDNLLCSIMPDLLVLCVLNPVLCSITAQTPL